MAIRNNQRLVIDIAFEVRALDFRVCGWPDEDGVLWETWQTGPVFTDPPGAQTTGWYMEERTYESFGSVGVVGEHTCDVSDVVYVECLETDEPAPSGSSMTLDEQYDLAMAQDMSSASWAEASGNPSFDQVRGLADFGFIDSHWGKWLEPLVGIEGLWNIAIAFPHDTNVGRISRSQGRFKINKSHWKAPVKFTWAQRRYNVSDFPTVLDEVSGDWVVTSSEQGELVSTDHVPAIIIDMPLTGSPVDALGMIVRIEDLRMRAPAPPA